MNIIDGDCPRVQARFCACGPRKRSAHSCVGICAALKRIVEAKKFSGGLIPGASHRRLAGAPKFGSMWARIRREKAANKADLTLAPSHDGNKQICPPTSHARVRLQKPLWLQVESQSKLRWNSYVVLPGRATIIATSRRHPVQLKMQLGLRNLQPQPYCAITVASMSFEIVDMSLEERASSAS